MIATLFALSTLPFVLAGVPPELFSPLVAQKSLATFHALPSPIEYPQYTDTTAGKWMYFAPNTWTSAFFPSSLYLLNTRAGLCGATASNGLGTADWLDLARSASTALLSVNARSGLGHDVGFISDPFAAELAVCVSGFPSFTSFCVETFGNVLLEIQTMRPPKQRSINSPVCWRRGLIPSLDVPGAGTHQTQQSSRWSRASVLQIFD